MDTNATAPELAAILRLLENAKVTVFSQDAELRYRWMANPPDDWQTSDVAGKGEIGVLPAKAAALASSLKRDVLHNQRPQWADLIVETENGTRYFDLCVEPERDAAGTIVGVSGLAVDVSDRRKQAATMDSVARDLSHRVKNLLAVIQSIGTQTARTTASTEDFIENFRGRIQSISRSQDLSIGARSHGARLSELLETQVHPYVDDIERRLAFDGEDRYLTPSAALHLGLALYELCISAVRSGTLAAPEGKVSVATRIIDEPDGQPARSLEVTWRESGGPAGQSVEGFSKVLLERLVPTAVSGRATLSTTAAGRHYALTISQDDFE